MSLEPAVEAYLRARALEFESISRERAAVLRGVGDYVRERNESARAARLLFVCTHNSRRSQIAQVWAAAAAQFCGVRVDSYSAGTEVLEFDSRAAAALERAGLRIESGESRLNAVRRARFAAHVPPLELFSKLVTQSPNPTADFAAVMVCSDADASCPTVSGAQRRFALAYDDPKLADGTRDETRAYDERCAQIARELLYAMSGAREPRESATGPGPSRGRRRPDR